MLSKLERKVMNVIYYKCQQKDPLLISPQDLKKIASVDVITCAEIQKIVENLYSDGYFDLVFTEKHGETLYCISLLKKGKGYIRAQQEFRRNLVFRVILSAGLAVMSFIIGLILKAIF